MPEGLTRIPHPAGRQYWTHEGECGVPFPHVHRGSGVVFQVDEDGHPRDIFMRELFADDAEATDAKD